MTTPARSRPWSGSSILRNVTSSWASLLVSIVVSFVLAPVTVQSLGNVYYGIWTLLMQFTGYLWLFDFGVRESVVKYVAQYHATDDRESIIVTVNTAVSMYGAVSLATVSAALLLALALPYAFNIPPESLWTARVTTVLVGGTVAQSFVFNVFVGVLMGLHKFYVMARLNMAVTIVRATLWYLFLTNGYGLIAVALVQFTMTLAQNLLVLYLCRRNLPYLVIKPAWPAKAEAVKLLNYGKYVLISNVGNKLAFATDSLVIGTFLPISALTYYAIGGSLIEQMRTFTASMATVLNPMSSSLQARRETGVLADIVLKGTRASVMLGLPLCVGFIFLGRTFIGLWMGAEYAGPSGDILAVLSVGHLFGLPYSSISAVLYGLNQHQIIAYSRIAEGLVNLAISIVLVQRLGVLGVALGTVIPHVIVVVGVLPLVLTRHVSIRLRDYYTSTYLMPLISAVPFALACWWIANVIVPGSLLAFFAAGAAAFIAYAIPWWFIALAGSERTALRGAVRRRLGNRTPAPIQETL